MRNVKKLQRTFIACQSVVERMEQRVFLSASLSGTVIGTAGSYQNLGNTAAKAFDNNISTYFDAPTASGSYTGLKLTAPAVISQIKYAPRNGYAYRMVGGVFQASNTADFSSGVVTLYTIKTEPANGTYTTVAIPNTQSFEYVRYLGPTNGDCNVAEVQFFGTASTGSATLEPNGTVVVNGTSGADTISVRYDVDASISANLLGLSITVNGQTQTIYGSTFKALQINSFDGNDSITVTNNTADELNDATPADFPIIINAGNGNDTISTAINYGHTSIDNSNVIPSVSIIAGNGDDTIDDESTYANYNVTVGNGNDSVSFDAGEGAINATVSAGNGNDLFSIGNESEFVTLNGGSGIDTIQVYDSNDSVTGTLGGKSILLKPLSADQQTVLTGTVYADTNGDGKYESGEPVAADAQVSFTWDSSVYTTTSNPDGSYSLTIPTGYYEDGQITGYGNTFPVSYFGELLDNINIALPQPLSGTNIGTAGSYKNDGNTIAKALDGNLSTYFDGPTANGNYVGRDLGSAKIISQIAYAPRAGYAYRMVGGIFQGSNSADFSSGVVNLYTITTQPTQGVLTVVPISNYNAYRYVRYLAPANSEGDVAEVQFFGTTPVTGATLQANGTLVVNGTTAADTINVTYGSVDDSTDLTTISVTINGVTQEIDGQPLHQVVINAGDGNNSITVTGSEENDDPNASDISMTLNGGSGNDTVNVNVDTEDENYDEVGNLITVNTGDGNNTVNLIYNGHATINGGSGNDYMYVQVGDAQGGAAATMNGGDGDDTMVSGSGGYAGVTAYGQGGNDTFINGDPDDYMDADGGTGTNTFELTGGAYVNFFAGPVNLQTGTFSSGMLKNIQNVSGDAGSGLTIIGNDQNNVFDVTGDNLSLYGGGGDDTFDVRNDPDCYIDGGPGNDTAYTDPTDTVVNVEHINPHQTVPTKLSGTPIGTAGSYQNDGNTISKVFDGNLTNYFDGPTASGDWAGLDFGSPTVVTQVKYAPRVGFESRMVGGEIQASNSADFSSGVVTLYTITAKPTAGVFTVQSLNNTTAYRYYRYLGPANSFGDLAELEFDG